MPNLIGQSLGRYHILEQLGEGGMATVYKAYDTRLERDVAVKVIRVEQFAPAVLQRILKRFEREAKALARLTHPNIVPVIDYGEYEGTPYLVMPYLPGGTLKQMLGKPMQWQKAVSILLPIASALQFAHEQGIVHRDVKPSNILITLSGQPMLSDFGIAKILEGEDAQTLTGTGMGVGTPEYMSPEQWTGGAGPQSDLYSLGVVLYELVTGHKPYTADTPAAILLKQASEPLPRPGQFVRDLPESIEKVLLKSLARKPEDRYSEMAAFSIALDDLLTGQSRPPWSTAQPAAHWSRTEKNKLPVEQEATLDERTPKPPHPVKPLSSSYSQSDSSTPPLAKKRLRWPWAVGAGVLLVAIIIIVALVVPGLLDDLTPLPIISPATNEGRVLDIGSTQISPKDGMVLVYVPAGEFLMGSVDSDPMASGDEKPRHSVTLDAYWIDRTEVTNGMYALCEQAGSCQPPKDLSSYKRNSYFGNPQYAEYPVILVDWKNAKTYCEWAGRSLPTEAEWEKAARGPFGRIYPWGNGSPDSTLLNYNMIVGDTTAVGNYPSGASLYGVLDMAGNVWEWVADWYGASYYSNSPSSNPAGPDSGQFRVLRGGSWGPNVYGVRSALRGKDNPSNSDSGIGFRCILASQ